VDTLRTNKDYSINHDKRVNKELLRS